MYRIVLIDDEPLVLAGIASLIPWEEYECTIVGKATNGNSAMELILELNPDIVITDIRMPVMNGLELIEACQKQGCEFAFLLLTNLEDFQLAQQAVRLGATDYLVKLDLQPQALIDALERAKDCCNLMKSHHKKELYSFLLKDSQAQVERSYFTQLLNPQKDEFPVNSELEKNYPFVYMILFQMMPEQIQFGQTDAYDFQFIRSQLLDIISGISSRYFARCTTLPQEKDTLALAVCPKLENDNEKALSDFCNKINVALSTYFALTAQFGISKRKEQLSELPEAFLEAKKALDDCYYESNRSISFYRPQTGERHRSSNREFNINFLKKAMYDAVLHNESSELHQIFDELSSLFRQYKPGKTQAVSACINIYSFFHDLFQEESADTEDFPYISDITEQLAQLGSLDDILLWLDSFCEKMCGLLTERKENRSDKLVYLAKRYINEHYTEKLTLSDIADHLRISSGHLSTTFSRYMNLTISDYIAQVKIEHAKELIDSGQYLIYEIAGQLGFDNAYYFSKVFKKVTGMSPRDYDSLHK